MCIHYTLIIPIFYLKCFVHITVYKIINKKHNLIYLISLANLKILIFRQLCVYQNHIQIYIWS